MSAESPADNPYAPPVAANGPKEAADNPPPSNNALVFLLIALAVFVVSAGLVLLLRAPLPGFLGFAIAALVAVCGFGIALVSFARVAFSPAPAPSGSVLRAIAGLLGNGAMALVGAAAALFVLMAFSRGRQLRRFGRILQPPLHKSADWARLAIGSEAGNQDCPTRRALAAQWRENGRTEHASVAAFARLTLDLMALGAPPELVAAANRDALDEIRHTELCFSLARSLDGESESPGPFPQASRARTLPRSRTLALSALAVDSLIDGALHEGVSARVIAKLARRCEDDPTRAILNGIAADEGRHAAHGWDVVEWCLAEGGAPVESALVGALRVLPHTIHTELPAAAADGSWERHGIHGHALESEAFSATREGLVGRLPEDDDEGDARRGLAPKMPTSAAFSPSRAHHNLGDAFFEEVAAASFPSAVLRFRNQRWAERLGLGDLDGREWEAHFARFLPLAATFEKPLALKYHGHQFGVYNRDLGDGRGFLFAQLVDGASKRLLDLGTKGSGTTPWSRSGDGRLTLKGGVREIIATEMLEALDVPTSKTFSVFETGEKLTRGDEPSPTRSCVLVRLGHSHIRFGTFQRLAYERDRDAMVRLIDHIVQHHDPDIAGATDVPRALFGSIVRRTAILGAAWDVAGFVHGVLNTDNMNVMGESFDYGPYRFLVRRDPKFVAAYFDQTGLYAFGRQAETLRWNLGRLADAMRLVTPTTPLSAEIAPFEEMFRAERARRFVSRLGVRSEGGDVDEALAGAAFELLEKEDCRADDFWFDWHGGAASERRAMEGSRKLSYRGSRFDAFRRMLEVYSPVCKNALASPYFSRTAPVTAHIDAIEGVWRAIESTDDWTPLEALVADIRELGAQCGGPAPG